VIYEGEGLSSKLNEEGIVTTIREDDGIKVETPIADFCKEYEKGTLGDFLNG